MTITHRPAPTRHGMHCTCGVFCGTDMDAWRWHRDDLLILHPGADTLEKRYTDLDRLAEGMKAIGQAYARLFENGGRAISKFAEALAADLRRGNDARARRLRAEQIAFLNRPVITNPPTTIDRITDV